MALQAKVSKERPIPSADTHVARVFQIVDLGTQVGTFEGKEKQAHKVRIGFELPEAMVTFDEDRGPEPFVLGKEVSLTFSPKSNLRKLAPSLLGRPLTEAEAKSGVDVMDFMGAGCLLTIEHYDRQDGGTGAKITNIAKLMKGQEIPPAVLPQVAYETEEGDSDTYKKLPEWLRETIAKSPEFTDAVEAATAF